MAERAGSEGRRAARGLVAGAAVLALLTGAAIYAPLFANDRPYVLTAIDRGAYRAALRTLPSIVGAAVELVERTAPAEGAGASGANRERDGLRGERLAAELAAARMRARTLRAYVPGVGDGQRRAAVETTPRGLIDALLAALDDVERTSRAGDGPAARVAAAELERLAARAGEELVARARGARAGVDGVDVVAGIELRPSTRFPLFAALSPLDVALMLAWALLAVHGVRRLRGRTWPRAGRLGLGLALCALIGLAHGLARDTPRGLVGARIKSGIASGEIEAERAWFPPIAMGYAETNMAEAFRPPTWLAAGGARWLAQDDGAARARVLPGEPALDAPLRHLLGTDGAGRDVLARLVWGGRVSLAVGFLSALLLTAIGIAVGALAGWAGGLTDLVLSRAIEVVAAFPAFFLVLAAMAFLDPEIVSPVIGIVVVIALVNWTSVARLVRAELLRLGRADFVLALESLGFSRRRILFAHVLPHALTPVWVAFAFAAAGGVLVESTISFLGFGVDRPTPSWGALIAESMSPERWWLSVFPGLAILATVSSTHLVAQGLRQAFDPHARDALAADAFASGAER